MAKTEPVKVETKLIHPYDPNFVDWNQLVNEADEVQGYRLLKDEEFDTLVGVPFVITKLINRQGEAIGNGHEGAYFSHEAVIAPEDVLNKFVKDLSKIAVAPGEHVVFNDGSTGIYRQIVQYLVGHGFIELPSPVIVNGKSGESTFDLPPEKWANFNPNAGDLRFDVNGAAIYTAHVRISCARGTRVSGYDAEGIGKAQTRYLG
jgi:hypothetical protein